jgi:hypothetical protein
MTCLAGLSPDSFYSFAVRAENQIGAGQPSKPQTIRTAQVTLISGGKIKKKLSKVFFPFTF